jgi:hypothetical protein
MDLASQLKEINIYVGVLETLADLLASTDVLL